MLDAATFFQLGTSRPDSEGQKQLALFAVFDACRIQDLLTLRQTCKAIFIGVEYYFDKVFDIEAALGKYLGGREHAMEFRRKQQLLGAALSGHFAVAFLGRQPELIPAVPLDIFLNHEDVHLLANWLFTIGFCFSAESEPATSDSPSFFRHIFQTRQSGYHGERTYSSFNYMFTRRKKVIFLHGVTRGLMDAVLSQHSTALFNIVTDSEVYSIFPLSTFQMRDYRGRTACQIHIYSSTTVCQGLVLIDCDRHLLIPEFDDGIRYIGDQDCWHMVLHPPVPPRERKEPSPPDGWSIEVVDVDSDCTLLRFRSQPAPPPSLLQLSSWEIRAVLSDAGDKVYLSYDSGRLMDDYHCIAASWRKNKRRLLKILESYERIWKDDPDFTLVSVTQAYCLRATLMPWLAQKHRVA
ncbi:hypothetical protein GYMLUDRAFT_62027 [Collybiopsis luxurians FD-317 M1]|uniref:Unplaced genomic scaffold GYMLUscaffold_50, whole genome shotgun sequence n=1 Tax=Collybiopsis luxurians FD-317 M1 TaxID=944289 RepID=A0A0D0C253_9AGAR|nr:hypothetical protein GYMLUDRAFT_62027 [Collybiopsis luxurians FD-317 M1]